MPHWSGFINGIPTWYNYGDKYIDASVEPGGLQFFGKLPQEEWDEWFKLFKTRATEALGFDVAEPEDGFKFIIYD